MVENGTRRIAVASLGACAVLGTLGLVVMGVLGREAPPALVGVLGAALGWIAAAAAAGIPPASKSPSEPSRP